MRLVIADNNIYMLHFRFGNAANYRGEECHSCECTVHAGPCKLRERPCGTESAYGRALCAKADVYMRATGRALALTRALHQGAIPRPVRRLIWARYFTVSRKPKARRA